ncbi:MAG: hypothetical protein AAB320_10730 [Elusimicrobiota bacterium]
MSRLLALLGLLVLAGPLWGAEGFYGDCTEDFTRLCAKERDAGRPALRECIKAHKLELSEACRGQLRGTAADPDAGVVVAISSAADPSGAVAVSSAAAAPDEAQTPPAAEAPKAAAAPRPIQSVARGCRNEKTMLCAEVQKKEAALLDCLQAHYREATTDCRAALDRARALAEMP